MSHYPELWLVYNSIRSVLKTVSVDCVEQVKVGDAMVVHMAHTLIGTDVVVVELCDIVVEKVAVLVDFCACVVAGPFDVGFIGEVSLVPLI